MLHRFEIHNDVHHWPQILSDFDLDYIFHQDYSGNISPNTKFEPQDAHFSSKQASLHCIIVYDKGKDWMYVYHISDNKGHDSAFTLLVTKNLIKNFMTLRITLWFVSKVVIVVNNIAVSMFLKLIWNFPKRLKNLLFCIMVSMDMDGD